MLGGAAPVGFLLVHAATTKRTKALAREGAVLKMWRGKGRKCHIGGAAPVAFLPVSAISHGNRDLAQTDLAGLTNPLDPG